MEQNRQLNSKISQEFRDMGFVTDLARRGVVTWIMGGQFCLLVGAVGVIVWLSNTNVEMSKKHTEDLKEINANHTQVLVEMLKLQNNIKARVDTALDQVK